MCEKGQVIRARAAAAAGGQTSNKGTWCRTDPVGMYRRLCGPNDSFIGRAVINTLYMATSRAALPKMAADKSSWTSLAVRGPRHEKEFGGAEAKENKAKNKSRKEMEDKVSAGERVGSNQPALAVPRDYHPRPP